MAQPVIVNVPASSQPQAITIQLDPRPPSWTDFAIYAPTIPGLVVAVLGLWVAHKFAAARDRRKEILELKELTKDALENAGEACTAAWLAAAGAERPSELIEAKSKLQTLGITATDLRRRTQRPWYIHIWHLFTDCPLAVDVVNDVARLRNVVTNDPFDDPTRGPDEIKVSEIAALASEIRSRIDLLFHQLYG